MDSYDDDSDFELDMYYVSDDEELQFDDDKRLDFEYQILTPDAVLKNMDDTVAEVNSVLQLPIATVWSLLNHFKWNQEGLMDGLYGDDQDKIFKQLQIPNPFNTSSQVVEQKLDGEEQSECEVCFVVFPGSELIGLECDHRFCYDCWNGHLNSKILDQGTDRISCLQYKCNTLMDQEKCLEILQDSRARQIYKRLVTRSFVECNHGLLWCPNPQCEMVIKVEYKQTMELVTCRCNVSFCCNCSKDWHSPLSCDLLKKWMTECNDDLPTINWLAVNSKQCPKCKTRIEKDGGCNHMTCTNTNCHYNFCWICLKKFNGYETHYCLGEINPNIQSEVNNRESERIEVSEENTKRKMNFFFHTKAYLAHRNSLELEENLVAKVQGKVNQLIKNGVRMLDAVVLKEAVASLRRCRKTLMYTYPFAYYLNEEHNQSVIFKNNQADLQRATEELSGYLEREIDEACFTNFRAKLLLLCEYCEERCSVLEQHVKEGYTGFNGIKDTQWEFKEKRFELI